MKRAEVMGVAALLAAGCLLGLGLGELGLRVFASVNTDFGSEFRGFDPLAVKIEPHGDWGYRPSPGSTFEYRNGTVAHNNERGYRGPVVAPGPHAAFRVILLGGSTTYGWGVNDDQSIDFHLRQVLSERYPGHPFEVVNLAFDGYDSWQLFQRLRSDGVALQPDAVIINSGINDVRNARFAALRDPDERTILWFSVIQRLEAERLQGGPTLWTRAKHHSYMLRLPGYVRNLGNRRAAPAAEVEVHDDAEEYFARNLRRIDSLLAPDSVSLVLSTPPSALNVNYAPDATSDVGYWLRDAATTQEYRERLARRAAALADSLRQSGRDVRYVRPVVQPDMFLDDTHLTPAGNRQVALEFADALAKMIEAWMETQS